MFSLRVVFATLLFVMISTSLLRPSKAMVPGEWKSPPGLQVTKKPGSVHKVPIELGAAKAAEQKKKPASVLKVEGVTKNGQKKKPASILKVEGLAKNGQKKKPVSVLKAERLAKN